MGSQESQPIQSSSQEEKKPTNSEPRTPENILPKPIFVDDLLNKNSTERVELAKILQTRGYGIIRLEGSSFGEKLESQMKELFQERDAYFKLDMSEKEKSKTVDRTNMGYIHVPLIREYLKLRPFEPELWPDNPPGLKKAFQNAFDSLKTVAWETFLCVADYEGNQLGDPKTMEAVENFVQNKSSLSLIHYFALNDPSLCPCDAHEDTGLITLGGFTDLPGLKMWDRVRKEWVEVEELMKPNDLVCFLGLKIPMFSASPKWVATNHKVEFDSTKERNSIVFLLDVAK